MQIDMRNAADLPPERIEEFLRASRTIDFAGKSRSEIYAWVEEVLVEQQYFAQGKKQRGVLRAYLSKVTGRSLPQITRLIRQYHDSGHVRVLAVRRHRFVRSYTIEDVRLLAEVDRAHERLAAQRRNASWSASLPSSAARSSHGLRAYRSPICTTCATRSSTAKPRGSSPRPHQPPSPSASAAGRSTMANRATCA